MQHSQRTLTKNYSYKQLDKTYYPPFPNSKAKNMMQSIAHYPSRDIDSFQNMTSSNLYKSQSPNMEVKPPVLWDKKNGNQHFTSQYQKTSNQLFQFQNKEKQKFQPKHKKTSSHHVFKDNSKPTWGDDPLRQILNSHQLNKDCSQSNNIFSPHDIPMIRILPHNEMAPCKSDRKDAPTVQNKNYEEWRNVHQTMMQNKQNQSNFLNFEQRYRNQGKFTKKETHRYSKQNYQEEGFLSLRQPMNSFHKKQQIKKQANQYLSVNYQMTNLCQQNPSKAPMFLKQKKSSCGVLENDSKQLLQQKKQTLSITCGAFQFAKIRDKIKKQQQQQVSTAINTNTNVKKNGHVRAVSFLQKSIKLNSPHNISKTPKQSSKCIGPDQTSKLKQQFFFKKEKTNKALPSKSGFPPSINDFYLGKIKGQGRFGKVFLAIHKEVGFLCAIKQVPKKNIEYMIQQFTDEIKIQLYLNHPNIVKLYSVFSDNDNIYLIMQYMEQGSLYSLIKSKKTLSQTQTSEKLTEIANGLKYIHSQSVVHRDLKPQNIVLTNDVCKLCDFGWAAYCSDRRKTYCGTLDYVSPQILDGNSYDFSVDIWCFGVLAYEMLVGMPPFYNISKKQTMNNIKMAQIKFPSSVSSCARDFIVKILKKKPEERIRIATIVKHPFLNTQSNL